MTRKVTVDVDDLHSVSEALFSAYQSEGEEWYLEVPLKMGLIEYREVTQEDLDKWKPEEVQAFKVGDMAYFILGTNDIRKKLCWSKK